MGWIQDFEDFVLYHTQRSLASLSSTTFSDHPNFLQAMRSTTLAALALAATTRVAAQQTLDDVCTVEYIQSVLPAPNFLLGVVPNNASITANPVTNYNVSASAGSIGGSGFDFCNVTFSYTHTGLDDTVNLWYWLPSPAQWQGRYLTTGGGGLSITSGQSGLVVGLPHGAVAGTTDGGFGGFDESIRTVILAGNGTLNNTMLVNFAVSLPMLILVSYHH